MLKITINTAVSSYNARIEDEFPNLFGDIGKIKNTQVQLHIDTNVTPKQQKHRRIPFHIRKDVEKELQRLEDLDIIEQVDGPTPWVSPIVVVPKKTGEIRLCVDRREANKAVQREKQPMPTVDELFTDLNGTTVFSTLDLASDYHQLELHPESRHKPRYVLGHSEKGLDFADISWRLHIPNDVGLLWVCLNSTCAECVHKEYYLVLTEGTFLTV
jgi:hypothetical protein